MAQGETIITDATVDFVVDGLSLRKSKSRIRKELQELIGREIHHVTFGRMYRMAKKKLLEKSRKSQDMAKSEAIGFYEHVISDEETTYSAKLIAQQRLDMLFNNEGKGREPDSPEDKAHKIRSLISQMDTSVVGEEDSDGSDSGEAE